MARAQCIRETRVVGNEGREREEPNPMRISRQLQVLWFLTP